MKFYHRSAVVFIARAGIVQNIFESVKLFLTVEDELHQFAEVVHKPVITMRHISKVRPNILDLLLHPCGGFVSQSPAATQTVLMFFTKPAPLRLWLETGTSFGMILPSGAPTITVLGVYTLRRRLRLERISPFSGITFCLITAMLTYFLMGHYPLASGACHPPFALFLLKLFGQAQIKWMIPAD